MSSSHTNTLETKLIDSFYGKCLQNITKQRAVRLCTVTDSDQYTRDPRCRGCEVFGEEVCEVSMEAETIKHDLPILIGWVTYQYAKVIVQNLSLILHLVIVIHY